MAEVERDQKTEEATAKRKRDSAQKGDVLSSRELATAVSMAAGTAWLALAGSWAIRSWSGMLAAGLTIDASTARSFVITDRISALLGLAIGPLAALFGISMLAAIASPAMLGSFGFRAASFAPKASRLNPIAGLGRMFGTHGLAELGKSIIKVALLGATGWWVITGDIAAINGLSGADATSAAALAGGTVVRLLLALSIALLAIAALDVPLQLRQRNVRLRMSKQEVRDEHKETEGSPELKSAIRARQHAILSNSARKAVTEAAVILTNPTHFAVALRYRPGMDAAPFVVARGRGATALAIKDLAQDNGVPTLDYPLLTRAIYFTSRAGQPIAHDLYVAVATVLAFVFNLDVSRTNLTDKPEIDVPDAKRFDQSGRPET